MFALANTVERLIDHARLVRTYDDTGNMLRTLYLLYFINVDFCYSQAILQIQRNIEGTQ